MLVTVLSGPKSSKVPLASQPSPCEINGYMSIYTYKDGSSEVRRRNSHLPFLICFCFALLFCPPRSWKTFWSYQKQTLPGASPGQQQWGVKNSAKEGPQWNPTPRDHSPVPSTSCTPKLQSNQARCTWHIPPPLLDPSRRFHRMACILLGHLEPRYGFLTNAASQNQKRGRILWKMFQNPLSCNHRLTTFENQCGSLQ